MVVNMKKLCAAVIATVVAIPLAGCDVEDIVAQSDDFWDKVMPETTTTEEKTTATETTTKAKSTTTINPPKNPLPKKTTKVTDQGKVATTTDFSGDYLTFYAKKGKAVVAYPDAPKGDIHYEPVDTLKRPTAAYGYITTDMYIPGKERESINFDPVGYGGNNKKVEISYDVNGDGVIEAGKGNPDKGYSGWFYNRSHMIADSLGGKAIRENMVTGTRMQNVGWNDGKGGMAYTETKARDYLKTPKAKNCPLYYAVSNNYVGSELLPRTTTVNIQSCDKSIDEQVVVDNVAPGYTINYVTGSFKKK